MDKHIVYTSQLQAMNDQILTDILTSATAYTVYCWMGYLLITFIIFLILRWIWNRLTSMFKKEHNMKW